MIRIPRTTLACIDCARPALGARAFDGVVGDAFDEEPEDLFRAPPQRDPHFVALVVESDMPG